MDCDGPKHALVRDVDGLLLDTSPLEGSVVPYAEIRYVASIIVQLKKKKNVNVWN